MMKIKKLEIGKKYGRLSVIRMNEQRTKGGQITWHCRCDCGNEIDAWGTKLNRGITKSCGCINKEKKFKHGDSGTRLHRIWIYMRFRCRSKNHKEFHRYAGRGIKVCPEWSEYIPFKKWALANGYADSLTIDRIDNDGNYCPENCQWISLEENSKKMRFDYFKKGYAVGYLSALLFLRKAGGE